jgi:carotenoid 1,2-hydratase
VAPNGYRWWYLDALSDDGAHGLTIIGFVGSVFSPYYAWARRRGFADPENYCAINVALYGRGGKRWCMTERGARDVARDEDHFAVGPSAMAWRDGSLEITIAETTVPVPRRVRGVVRLTPSALSDHQERLDAAGLHGWQPVAPFARVTAAFESPALRWSGAGYHDMNWGAEPLEKAFTSWTWSRAAVKDAAYVLYDTQRRDGSRYAFALRFDAQGRASPCPMPKTVALGRSAWHMDLETPSETPATIISPLEDTPFYARSLVAAQIDGAPVTSFHESLSLDRFRNPVVQAMLPFRMPRRAS